MRNPEAIVEQISSEVKIHVVRFLQAKSFIMNYQTDLDDDVIDVPTALQKYLALCTIVKPAKYIIYNDEALNDTQIDSIKSYYEFGLAFCEALLSLINSTIFVKFDTLFSLDIGLPYAHEGNQNGTDGYFTFKKFKIQCPQRIKRTFASLHKEFLFSDPDMFLLEIDIKNAHLDVIEALNDCILCFKNELYRPAITMLGKAVEGAWIEVGISLLKYVEDKKSDSQKIIEKFMGKEDFVWKLEQVIKLYHRQDWFEDLAKKSGIKPAHLLEVFNWTEVVRDSRNAIHFGVSPAVPNTFDKASILLMLAVKHLRTLYSLKRHTDTSY